MLVPRCQGECGGACTADYDNNSVRDDNEVYGCAYELAENFDPAVITTMARAFSHAKVNVNVFDWDGDYNVTVTDFLMMLSGVWRHRC